MQTTSQKVGFLKGIIQTFSPGSLYGNLVIERVPSKFSASLLFGFYFIFGVIFSSAIFYFKLLPVRNFLNFLPARLLENFPQDLEIVLKQGKLSVNKPQPYYIPLAGLRDIFNDNDNQVLGYNDLVDNLLVIDTKAKPETFGIYKTYLLATQDFLIFRNDSGGLEVFYLGKFPDVTINRQFVGNTFLLLGQYLPNLLTAATAALFLCCTILLPISYYVLSYLTALYLVAIFTILKISCSYPTCRQISRHLFIVIGTASLPLSLIGISYLYLLFGLFAVLGLVCCLKIKSFFIKQRLLLDTS